MKDEKRPKEGQLITWEVHELKEARANKQEIAAFRISVITEGSL